MDKIESLAFIEALRREFPGFAKDRAESMLKNVLVDMPSSVADQAFRRLVRETDTHFGPTSKAVIDAFRIETSEKRRQELATPAPQIDDSQRKRNFDLAKPLIREWLTGKDSRNERVAPHIREWVERVTKPDYVYVDESPAIALSRKN